MGPHELLLQLRRARSLVRTAAMLTKGGPSAQRAAAQAAVEVAQQALQQQLGASAAAQAAARMAVHAVAATLTGNGGALACALTGLSLRHPISREVLALRKLLESSDPHPAVLQMRVERLSVALATSNPSAARALQSALVGLREAEHFLRDAVVARRLVGALWAEMRGLTDDLADLLAL